MQKTPINFLDLWFGNIWISRSVALITSLNLGLVLFDLSYVPWRDFWLLGKVTVLAVRLGPFKYQGISLKLLPQSLSSVITEYYDPIKGIEPYRETADYLKTVSQLEDNLFQLDSPESAQLLEKLQKESADIINTNPFQVANKTGNLERIKNLMRQYVPNKQNSAKQSFRTFWSQEYLKENTVSKINFFNDKIQPLIFTNYYRKIDENGKFTDYFYLIDFPFFVLFVIDFLGRTLYTTRLYPGLKWREAMLWRWYDLFLLMPIFQILRVIPVTIRLHETQITNLQLVQKQVTQGFVSAIATEMTEVVLLQVFNRVEHSIERGSVFKILLQKNSKEYIDLNGKNEIREILVILLQFVSEMVFPQVRPDLQILLEYLIQKSLQDTPIYGQLRILPGFEALQKQVINQTLDNLFTIFSETLHQILEEDPIFDKYLQNVQNSLSKSIVDIQNYQYSPQLKLLFRELLQEIKVNYIQNLQEEEIQKILEEKRMRND